MIKLFNKETNLESKTFKVISPIYFENSYKKMKRDKSPEYKDKSVSRAFKYLDTILNASVKKCPNDYDRTALVVYGGKLPLGYIAKEDKPEVLKLLNKAKYISVTITGGDYRLDEVQLTNLPEAYLTIKYKA